MNPVSRFAFGDLRGSSYREGSASTLLDDEFDLLIVVSSWEERVRSILEGSNLRVRSSFLVLYKEVDPDGLRAHNDELLERYLKELSSDARGLVTSATDLETTWRSILTQVVEAYTTLRRPVRVLLDASTCQRYHILALLNNGFRYGLIRHLSVFYAEGEYPSMLEGEEIVFGDGLWKSIPVPGLEGEYGPGKSLHYYVSVGFEGYKTLRVVARADPDRVRLLFPHPGTNAGYSERTRAANAGLIEQYGIGDAGIVDAPASDAIAAWAAMTTADWEQIATENVVYLLNGTKPHSLAMGLRAMCLRTPTVLYSVPEAYHVVNIRASGVYWRFDIENRTVPT